MSPNGSNQDTSGGQQSRPVLLLVKQKQEAENLAFQLRLKGKGDEADKLTEKAKSLQEQIDQLLKKSMEEWMSKAEALQADLEKAVQGLEASTAEIKKNVETAQNITKALGFVDDAIGIARKLTTGV